MTNQTNILRTSFVQVCSLLCITLAFILTGCSKDKGPEEKVLTRGFMYLEPTAKCMILEIEKSGTVWTGEWEPVGVPWSWWKSCGKNVGNQLSRYPGYTYTLEGPGMVGDHFKYRLYYKEVLLSTGEMKKVLEKVTIESDKMEDYKKQMAAASPETK